MQFLVLAGNRFWFYILLMYLGYRTIQLWCCVSFFGIFFVVAGKWFWREISRFFVVAGKFYYDRKKKLYSFVWRVVLLCQLLVLAITTGKKSSSRLSGGLCCCVSFWFWREIGSFFVVAGKFYYNRKKKFQSSV